MMELRVLISGTMVQKKACKTQEDVYDDLALTSRYHFRASVAEGWWEYDIRRRDAFVVNRYDPQIR